MDLHPVLVHFPIAFLTLYALMELLRFRRLTEWPAWFYSKTLLLFAGTAGALLALESGEKAAEAFPYNAYNIQVLAAHEIAAKTATAVFLILSALYVLSFLKKFIFKDAAGEGKRHLVWRTQKFFTERWPVAVIALAGLLAISLTGALGGMLVHGPDVDPWTRVLYNFLEQTDFDFTRFSEIGERD